MDISVAIPVYNEADNLEPLFERLCITMDSIGKAWEVIFVNDGSLDKSLELLKSFHEKRPDVVKVIDFNGNYGQHPALMCAFANASGEIVITLDADLQNPPEEIKKLLEKIYEGYDAVGGYRKEREDSFWRRYLSKIVNIAREKMTNIEMLDQGCMLRAYKRNIVQAMLNCGDRATFIPALAYTFASNPTDVEVEHCARQAGESKYNLYKLIRLNFDLVTGFTLIPLQLFTLFGFVAAAASLSLFSLLVFRRLFMGSEAEGMFTLFAFMFFLISVAVIGIGLVGEYVGRIYQVVQARPRYVLKERIGFDK